MRPRLVVLAVLATAVLAPGNVFASGFAADPQDVAASRPSNYRLTNQQALQAIMNKGANDSWPESRTVHGIEIENDSPTLIASLERLTDTTRDMVYSAKRLQAEFKKTGCNKVACAVQKIFGVHQGLMLMVIDLYFGVNASYLQHSRGVAWSAEQLDLIFNVLEDLPIHLAPFTQNRPFVLLNIETESTYANSSVIVFQNFLELEPEMQRYALFHEMGHVMAGVIDRKHALDESPEWLALSGWVSNKKDESSGSRNEGGKKPWTLNNPGQCVSEYAKVSPSEDFAESAASYRYAPAKLKARSPKKYAFLKELVFDGVEYARNKVDPRQQHPTSQTLILDPASKFDETDATQWAEQVCANEVLKGVADAFAMHRSLLSMPSNVRDCIARGTQGYVALRQAKEKSDWSFPDLLPYSTLVRPNYTKTSLNKQWDPQWPTQVRTRFEADLRSALTEFALAMEQPKRYQFNTSQNSVEDFCTANTKYAYQDANTPLNKVFDHEGLDSKESSRQSNVSFPQRDFLSGLAFKLCTTVREGDVTTTYPGKATPADPERVKSAINAAIDGT